MIIKQDKWYFVTGKAGHGKTYWIKEHLRHMPQDLLWIIDYNGTEYSEFKRAKRLIAKLPADIDHFLLEAYKKGDCIVILGDCDSYIRKGEMSPIRKMFVNTARNRRICAIFDAKRCLNIPPDVRGRINYSVIFKKTEGKDIISHEEWAGEDKGFFDALRNLDVNEKTKGEHVVYNHDESKLEIMGPV